MPFAFILTFFHALPSALLRSGQEQASYKVRDSRLIVANTHVCFNPSKGEVKLGQVRTLLAKVGECWPMAFTGQPGRGGRPAPVLPAPKLCGT